MQGQIELFRCKNIHGIRHKLHIFANRLLLRRDIQQSQCRCNHRRLSLYTTAGNFAGVIGISDVPVFVGVGGGITGGDRSVRLAIEAENQGAFGVVVNAPISNEVISRIKEVVDIPVIATIVSDQMDIRSRIEAGADFLNVSGAAATPQIVRRIRAQFPNIPILATGGPNDETILETIHAGANAITYSPPSNGELFAAIMQKYRGKL